jgi:hypothetical protein
VIPSVIVTEPNSDSTGLGQVRAVSAVSTERPVFHQQRPYRCTAANWRLEPQPDSCSAARVELFAHLVGAPEQGERHGDARRLRRLQVDNQLDLGLLLHSQVGMLFAFQDAARVDAGKAVRFGKFAVTTNGRSAQREASRAQRFKSIFSCLSSAMC